MDNDDGSATSPDAPPSDGHPGRYADGKSAAIHEVRLRFQGDGIQILDAAGAALALWSYDDIRLIESPAPGHPVRLRLLSDEMARLQFASDGALDELRRLAPALERVGMRDPAQWRRAAVWIAGFVVVLGGLWFGLSRSAPLIAAALPMSVEDRMGRATVEQVALVFGGFEGIDELTCRRRSGLRALEAMTERLAAVDDSPYEFKVRVLDIDIPNAFAAPGGYIVIFRGLIDLAETPDEVAGVLAHEMGHVVHRHSTTHLVRVIGFQSLIVPLITGGTMASDVLSEVGQAALQASFTREAEEDADRVAVDLMNRAGLKAATFTDLLMRIEREFGDPAEEADQGGDAGEADSGRRTFSIPDMLATHPSTPDRARQAQELAAPGGEPGLDERQWKALQSICG